MARKTFPFGFSRGYIAQAPAPLTGMTRTPTGYSELNEFVNGGAAITDSAAKHNIYSMSFSGDASALNGIEVFQQFAQGLFGRGPLYFSDPMAYETNLLPPHFATPHLSEQNWKQPFLGTPTYAAATPNAYMPYSRSAAFLLSGAASVEPTHPSKVATILIPPTHKLWVGFRGTMTGTGKMRVQPINIGGTLAATQDLAMITNSAASGAQMNASFDGATFQAVEIYVTRTSDDASDTSTATIFGGMAQLWPRGVTPVLIGRHVPGEGHTGCRFSDGAIPETYKMTRGHKKQLSTNLVEVGAWL